MKKPHPFPGTLVTFEGIDGSGKTVQAERLAGHLRATGFEVVAVRDPGGPEISEQIRGILLNVQNSGMSSVAELMLYEAARAQLVHEKIRPALESGAVVVCDRFTDSTLAYQGFGRGLPVDLVREANAMGSLGIRPDRTFFLDIDWDESLRRRRKIQKTADRMESNARTFFDAIRNGYLKLCREEPERAVKLDGARSVEILERIIRNDVLKWIADKQEKG